VEVFRSKREYYFRADFYKHCKGVASEDLRSRSEYTLGLITICTAKGSLVETLGTSGLIFHMHCKGFARTR